MKINIEMDITPEEVKTLFEGNMELMQKTAMESFVKHLSHIESPDDSVTKFWQSMAEKSGDMFAQYQKAMASKST